MALSAMRRSGQWHAWIISDALLRKVDGLLPGLQTAHAIVLNLVFSVAILKISFLFQYRDDQPVSNASLVFAPTIIPQPTKIKDRILQGYTIVTLSQYFCALLNMPRRVGCNLFVTIYFHRFQPPDFL